MENRSFDQMLGYLKRDGMAEVRGLDGASTTQMPTGTSIRPSNGKRARPSFTRRSTPPARSSTPATPSAAWPSSSPPATAGSSRNFLATRQKDGKPVELPPEYHRLPMGHYRAKHLPMYDFLARNYCVCDAWHSSVPGDTWPNRLFAMPGARGPTRPALAARAGAGAPRKRAAPVPKRADLRRSRRSPASWATAVALVFPRPGDAAGGRRALPRLRQPRPRQLRLLRPQAGEHG